MVELMRRYLVMSLATEAPFDPNDPDGVFVLKPWKDPAGLCALETYRENCYPELARDLEGWIRAIKAGPVVRGDVGKRNEPFVTRGPVRGATKPARKAAKAVVRKKVSRRKPRRR